ncbi:hypothetical protein DVH24_038898 [Malus domestica]|uniref:ZF-HD dimerization-type domain-containing protein n=1 Tax=Malus domestica TaxID=3750 RepID=A0A498KE11_MALDO|nr:hypothetical protein DVH24_038898 [Malus domestica]
MYEANSNFQKGSTQGIYGHSPKFRGSVPKSRVPHPSNKTPPKTPIKPLHHPPPQQTLDRSRRDPDPTPNPVIVTPSAATIIASRSNFKAPAAPPQPPPSTAASRVRYRKCLKNHATSSDGHVLNGCGEFMPGGDEDTSGSLKCAACECHRNFHIKEIDREHVSNN